MQTLKDKHILVIGANGGIGSRTAKLLAGSGAKVFLTGRNAEKLQAVAVSCNILPDRCLALDCSQGGSVNELKERYFQQFPTIDILINAAGVGIIKAMETLDEADFLRTLNANLVAPFLLMKEFLPAMKEAKTGLIFNIPGVLGKVPRPVQPPIAPANTGSSA
jgi:short-subunit dehydrogenase